MAESVTLPLDNACLISCNDCHKAILMTKDEAEETSTCSCGSNNLKKIYYDQESLNKDKEAAAEEIKEEEENYKKASQHTAEEQAQKKAKTVLVENDFLINGDKKRILMLPQFSSSYQAIMKPHIKGKAKFTRYPCVWIDNKGVKNGTK